MTSPDLPAPGPDRIQQDIACLRCGYNLRTQASNGCCPECGAAVQRTLAGDALADADRAWLRRVSAGLGLTIITIAAVLALTTLTHVIYAFGLAPPGPLRAFEIAARGAAVLGAWRFATPQPGGLHRPEPIDARGAVRILAVAQFAAAILHPDLCPDLIGRRALGVLGVSASVGYVAGAMVLTRNLAQRIPADADARMARNVLWGFAFGAAVIAFAVIAEWVWGRPGRSMLVPWVGVGLAWIMAQTFTAIVCLSRVQRQMAALAETPPANPPAG